MEQSTQDQQNKSEESTPAKPSTTKNTKKYTPFKNMPIWKKIALIILWIITIILSVFFVSTIVSTVNCEERHTCLSAGWGLLALIFPGCYPLFLTASIIFIIWQVRAYKNYDPTAETETSTKKNDKPNNQFIFFTILIVIITVVAIFGFIAYGNEKTQTDYYQKQYSKALEELEDARYNASSNEIETNNDSTQDNENDSTENKEKLVIKFNGTDDHNKRFTINSDKCINCSKMLFNETPSFNSFDVLYSQDSLTINSEDVNSNNLAHGEYNFQFNSPVTYTDTYYFGNGGDMYIFFLKENGTLSYIIPYTGTFRYDDDLYREGMTVYDVEGVENVDYLLQAGSMDQDAEHGNGGTVLAFRSDGYYYDLEKIIYGWGE